jgi:hypothetical protein
MIMTAFDTVLLVLHKKLYDSMFFHAIHQYISIFNSTALVRLSPMRLLQSCDTYKAPPTPLAAEDIFADDQ